MSSDGMSSDGISSAGTPSSGHVAPAGNPSAAANLSAAGDPSAAQERASLWGGRFGSGPAAALAALSVSTHFDWQPGAVRPAGVQGPRERPAHRGSAER